MITDPIKFVYAVGDGNTTDFSYAFNGTVGFDADVAEDVKAAILNPDGTRELNPNFAVLQDAYKNFTGFIRFATAPAENAIIYIYRATPRTQNTQYRTFSGFDAQTVEKDMDKLTKVAQETANHAYNKTLQLDMFQQTVLKLVLTSAANQNQLMFVDWGTLTIRFTPFTKGQIIITPAAGENDTTAIMMKVNYDEDGHPFLEYSLNGGANWIAIVAPDIQILSQVLGDYRDLLPNDAGVKPQTFVEAINAERTDRVAAFSTEITSGDLAEDNTPPTAGTWSLWGAIKKLFANIVWAISSIKINAMAIAALQGIGGALTATDLGASPTQETLTKYAVDQIWHNNTDWVWDATNPVASTFTDENGVARTAAEIFNGTWVNNLNSDPAQTGHKWQLVNTQDTDPKVFLWTDVGQAIVSIANGTTAGVVRVGAASQMIVDPTTGDIALDPTKASNIRATIGAVAKLATDTTRVQIYADAPGGAQLTGLYLRYYTPTPGAFTGNIPAYGGISGASLSVGTPNASADATPKVYVDAEVRKNYSRPTRMSALADAQDVDLSDGIGSEYLDNRTENTAAAAINLTSSLAVATNNVMNTKQIRIVVGDVIPSLSWTANYNGTTYPVRWVDDSLATISDANKTTIFVFEIIKVGDIIEFVGNRAGVY